MEAEQALCALDQPLRSVFGKWRSERRGINAELRIREIVGKGRDGDNAR
jgi:hypothetical protein